MKKVQISPHKDTTIALCLDTLNLDKQALVFCSSKKSAESVAEKIAIILLKNKKANLDLDKLAYQIENALQSPTKQCKRLSKCVQTGIAFHHAGLTSKQRELIEDQFRTGKIKIICSTPTLAAGLDLPAFRAIIKDTKRFGPRGMVPIPVLEYEQMSGRAGRPGQEEYGEAIIIASEKEHIDYFVKNYINGKVEEIYSKLAVEPVLRMHILSLISSKKISSKNQLYSFFDSTFYAFQFGDKGSLHLKLDSTINQLQKWNMLIPFEEKNSNSFSSGLDFLKTKNQTLQATPLGERVSQIYIDPLTANTLINSLKKTNKNNVSDENFFAITHLISCSLEMRPLLSLKANEYEEFHLNFDKQEILLNEEEFSKISTDDYDSTIKTAFFLCDWANEISEEKLFDKYNVRPGEIHAKLNIVDWLLYASEELCRLENMHYIIKSLKHARKRLVEGVKAELLPLLNFKGIGRIRARVLFNKGIKDVGDIVSIDMNLLTSLIGPALSLSLKKQVGIEEKTTKKEFKGTSQAGLGDFF